MGPEHRPYLQFRRQTQGSQQQLAPDAAGHNQLSRCDVLTVLKGHTPAISIETGHGAVFDQLMTGVAGGVDPVGDNLVAAHGPRGGFKQTGEVGLRFQWETAGDLAGIESLVGDVLVVHNAAGTRDGSLDRFLIPAFAVKQQAVGLTQLFSCVDLFLAPEPVGLLRQSTKHRVGVHLPEHACFAETAGLGMGQCVCFQQHDVRDATTCKGGSAAEAGHAAAHDHDRCLAGGGVGHAHSLSPKLRPMGSWLGVAATSSRASPADRPWSRWLR